MKSFDGYLKLKLGDGYVLLAGGSHKAVSDFATSGHNHNSSYVSSVAISGDYLRVTKNGSNSDLTIPYADYSGYTPQLSQTSISDLSSFTHSTNLIYAAAGGNNSVLDKPSGVDAFGVISYKTASGWYGLLLTSVDGNLYIRSAKSLSGGWKKILDSDNSSVSKSGETLTVKINSSSQSLTNTWRGILNNLTSTSTIDSLSAAQGKVLNDKFESYLPLSGGIMTGCISKAGTSKLWYQGRDTSLIRTTSYSGYNALVSMKTTDGSWELGVYSNNTAYLTYITDANYDAKSNTPTYQLIFPNKKDTLAVLGDIPTDYYSSTKSRTANTVLAAPNGSAGAATFRALVATDIPSLSEMYVTLSGTQTIIGDKTFSGTKASILTIDRNSTSPTWVKFDSNGTLLGYLGVNNSHEARFHNGTKDYEIWHSGNFTPSNYLPLSGGALTSSLSINYSSADFTKADNGVTSTLYPGFFIRDKNGKQTGRLFTSVMSNGKLITYLYSNNYNTSGTSVGEMYLGQEISKDGTKRWVLTDAASFRTALGLGTNATSSTAYLPLSGGTMTGSIFFRSALTAESTNTGSATGLFGKYGYPEAGDTGSNKGGIGFLFGRATTTDHDSLSGIFINADTSTNPWSTTGGLYITASTIKFRDNTIWHAGNDGSGSGLNADMLDGTHKSDLFTEFIADGIITKITIGGIDKSLTIPYSIQANRLFAAQILKANTSGDANTMQLDNNGTIYSVLTNYWSNPMWQNMPTFGTDAYGGVVEIKGLDASLKMQLAWSAVHNDETSPTNGLWFRARANKGYVSTDWHRVAFTDSDITGKAANVTGVVAIEHGGTGTNTRLGAVKALTNENVSTDADYFLTITSSWGKAGYTSVANAKTVLAMTGATDSTAGTAGVVPAPAKGKQTSFLRGDGTWVVPTNTTYSDFVKSGESAAHGLVPKPPTTAGTTHYLREDGTWTVPPNTTYSAGTLALYNTGTDTANRVWSASILKSIGNLYLPLAGGTMSNTNKITNLNADLLDGAHGKEFYSLSINNTTAIASGDNLNSYTTPGTFHTSGGNTGSSVASSLLNKPSFAGGFRMYVTSLDPSNAYISQRIISYAGRVFDRVSDSINTDTPWENKVWHELAYIDSNVASATKLYTSCSLWGQSFDGTADIKGNITLEGGIYLWESSGHTHDFDIAWKEDVLQMYAYQTKYWDLCIGTSTEGVSSNGGLYYDASAKAWGIGIASPSYKLHVSGDIYSTGHIRATSGFVKASSSDSYVLLGGGGHAPLTNLQVTGTATSVTSLNVGKTFIYATITASATLGLSAAMSVGQVLTVLIFNNSSATITLTVPSAWKSLDGYSIYIGALKFGEISILCYASGSYIVSSKIQ